MTERRTALSRHATALDRIALVRTCLQVLGTRPVQIQSDLHPGTIQVSRAAPLLTISKLTLVSFISIF
jgi:hypothetical protein